MSYIFSKRRSSRTSRKREAGQALALAAVSLTVLLLAAGLAIDMGFLRYQKRRIQSAADSAAIAGAAEINYLSQEPSSSVTSSALADAATDGFTNGGTTQVTVQCGATVQAFGGGCSSATPFVQVTVSQQEPLFFMKIIPGITMPTVSAQAVGFLGNGTSCMYALGAGGINGPVAAQTNVNAECAVMSNGPINIGACTGFAASAIGYTTSSNLAGCATSQPMATQATDPLASLAAPGIPGTCIPALMYSYTNATPAPLSPGNYPCGIQILGGSTVTFMPGTYVLAGGLTIEGNGNNVTGNGVTFYNANGPILICASQTPSIVSGTNCPGSYMNDSITLTAQTTGTYAGILFFQDAGDPQQATILGNDAFGNGFTTMEGIFYFPAAQLTLAELTPQTAQLTPPSTWQASYNAAVASSLTLVGTIQFGNGSAYLPTLPNGSPIKDAVLAQ